VTIHLGIVLSISKRVSQGGGSPCEAPAKVGRLIAPAFGAPEKEILDKPVG
jgi:hypothetical protein